MKLRAGQYGFKLKSYFFLSNLIFDSFSCLKKNLQITMFPLQLPGIQGISNSFTKTVSVGNIWHWIVVGSKLLHKIRSLHEKKILFHIPNKFMLNLPL